VGHHRTSTLGEVFNRYAYANTSPYKFSDPDGRAAQTILDVVSVGLSIAAFKNEPSLRNGLGLAYNVVATGVPFLRKSTVDELNKQYPPK
jgi:hypothetical protein